MTMFTATVDFMMIRVGIIGPPINWQAQLLA